MAKQFNVTTNIQGGLLRFDLHKVSNHASLGSIQNSNNLTVTLADGESYVMGYQVVSHSPTCTYSVVAQLNGVTLWNISTQLHEHDIDYNAQKFNT